ncbi:MAG: xylulokinase [Sphaerochaetaceae bacterium]|nr:xylulokinase [Sphaerochaetaceae bacterium]
MFVMGIDEGTQSVKCLVYDSQKKEVVKIATENVQLISLDGGIREQKSSWWIEAIERCFKKLGKDTLSHVDAISVSGQQHGFVPMTKSGDVLHNVKLWCDTSTVKECEEITTSYGGEEKLIANVGNPILPGYTASKILYFKKNYPDLYKKMDYVLLPHDYINYYLCGHIIMERGDASGTGLLNLYKGEWDKELCSIISNTLLSKLPPILSEPSIIGKVKSSLVTDFGFNKDCVVTSGGGDNMMAAIGTGCVNKGDVTISLGTSGTLFTSTDFVVTDKKKRIAAFASSHNSYLPLLCTMNCTVSTEEIRNRYNLSVEDFNLKAQKAPIGANGLIFLPFLNGERVPSLPKAEAIFGGIRIGNYTVENIARAVFEGVSMSLMPGLEAFKELGIEIRRIILTGGGSNSSLWREIIANLTGYPVYVPRNKEGAAFGAALHSLLLKTNSNISDVINSHLSFDEGASVVPNNEDFKKYKKIYEKWISYEKALEIIFK